jgi:type IV secretion system protein VirB3
VTFEPERLAAEPLFLACTRPALFLGVPMEAVALNVMATSVTFLATGSWRYLLVTPALHLVFRAVCKSDPNAFRVLYLFVETKGRARNGALWGGSSVSPLLLRRRPDPRMSRRG